MNHLFQNTRIDWLKHFDRKMLIENLYLAEKGRARFISAATFRKLRNTRTDAQRLRTAYVLFDERHQAPPDFEEFVNRFGKLKDALISGERIEKRAQDLRLLIERGSPVDAARSFIAARPESLFQVLEIAAANLSDFSMESKLLAVDYHELRKDIRLFTTYFKFLQTGYGLSEFDPLIKRLARLNQLTGDAHDRAVWADLRGDDDYDLRELRVPPEAKEVATELRQLLSKVRESSAFDGDLFLRLNPQWHGHLCGTTLSL